MLVRWRPVINRGTGQGVMEGGGRLVKATGDLVSPETKAKTKRR